MKFDEKYASLKDKPSGIARQLVVTESHAKANKGKARSNVHLEDAGTEFASRLAGGRTPAPITPEKGGDRKPLEKVSGRPPRVSKARREKAKKALAEAETRTDKLTKAQKVKAWREANPELYAAQKRRTAERQAKKRAEKEQN